jgi:chemotaxis signal transduction protein
VTSAQLLRRRAEELARPVALESAPALELMVFGVGAALYAVPLGIVRGVLTEAVTPIPGVQPWIAGCINVRGEVRSVIDAAVVFDPSASRTVSRCVLLLETPFGVVGWLLTAWPQLQRVSANELTAPLSGQTAVAGVLLGTIALLDIDRLLESLSA